jgi:hypothetical protein
MPVSHRIVIVAVLAAVAWLLTPISAAHAVNGAGTFYADRKWPTGTDMTFYFDDGSTDHDGTASAGFPHSVDWRARMDNAVSAWNNSDSDPDKPTFTRATGSTAYGLFGPYWAPCGLTHTAQVYQADLSWDMAAAGGAAYLCTTSTVPKLALKMAIVFRELPPGYAWYVGTGTPPLLQYDLWSIATHEFGHGTGWVGHWNTPYPAQCPGNGTDQTMCGTYYQANTFWRSLGTSDIETWHSAY